MSAMLMALTYALIVGGLSGLAYFFTPGARLARGRREHQRQLREIGVDVPVDEIEYAAHAGR